MREFWRFFIILGSLLQLAGSRAEAMIHGIRLDPGYLYTHKESETEILANVKRWGFNAVFVYVYSSAYGAFYPLENSRVADSMNEAGIGKTDFLAKLFRAAKKSGIKVYAIFPANQYDSVYEKHPDWRAKKADRSDYRPAPELKFLSYFSADFRNWHQALIGDFLKRFPSVDGIEIVEPSIDLHWKNEVDFHPAALAFYQKSCAGEAPITDKLSDCALKARSAGLTEFLGQVSGLAHQAKKEFGVVQTWPVGPDGKLLDNAAVAKATGFDFLEISQLRGAKAVDLFSIELIWQQWKNEHKGRALASTESASDAFNPGWTFRAVKELQEKLGAKLPLSVHVELSAFGEVKPTLEQTKGLLAELAKGSNHWDVYDYAQMHAAFIPQSFK